MVVLDAIHWIQAHQAPDLAVRWNCKAAKCGSCSAEVNGKPRADVQDAHGSLRRRTSRSRSRPMKTFPLIKDLVTDVSWNYEVNKRIPPFTPRDGAPRGLALAAVGRRSRAGVPQVHRVLPVPGRLPRAARARAEAPVRRPALPGADRRPRDAPDRRRRPDRVPEGDGGHRLLQHHQVLHRGAAPSASTSPTTRSSRSRSASWTSTTIRSGGSRGSCAAVTRVAAHGSSCRCCRPGPRQAPPTRPAPPCREPPDRPRTAGAGKADA